VCGGEGWNNRLGLSASLLAEAGILKLVVKVIVTSFTETFLAF
jgi:hypothetical protein